MRTAGDTRPFSCPKRDGLDDAPRYLRGVEDSDLQGRAGQPVTVDYSPPAKPTSDIGRLAEFMGSDFARESIAISKLARRVTFDPDKRMLHELGGRALAFRQVLGHWEAVAKRLYRHEYATQLDLTRDEHADSKRTGREIEAAAEQPILVLREALDRIGNEKDQMREFAWWAREQFRSMNLEEMTGEAAGSTEDFTFPQFDAGLSGLDR